MASFDFVECSVTSYKFVWEHRMDVIRLSAVMLAIKAVFLIGLTVFNLEGNILWQGLIMLPVYLFEGWVIAQLMVMALYKNVADAMAGRSILPPPQDIERNIKASMILYGLVKLALSFVVGVTMSANTGDVVNAASPEPNAQNFLVALMVLGFMVWAFRFLWLYVSMVMGKGPLDFLMKFQSFSDSFHFIGVWVLCFVPLLIAMILFSEIIGGAFNVLGAAPGSIVSDSALAMLQAVFDYIIGLVSSVGVAYGVYSAFSDENKKTPIL